MQKAHHNKLLASTIAGTECANSGGGSNEDATVNIGGSNEDNTLLCSGDSTKQIKADPKNAKLLRISSSSGLKNLLN